MTDNYSKNRQFLSDEKIDTDHPFALSKTTSGGVSNTKMHDWDVSWSGLIETLSNPSIGDKEGTYFLRGQSNGNRSDKNLTDVSFAIIDADKSFDPNDIDPKTGKPRVSIYPDVTDEKGKPVEWNKYTLEETCAVLKEAGIAFIGYTSHSHQKYGTDFNKFRILIPLQGEAKQDFHGVVRYVLQILND